MTNFQGYQPNPYGMPYYNPYNPYLQPSCPSTFQQNVQSNYQQQSNFYSPRQPQPIPAYEIQAQNSQYYNNFQRSQVYTQQNNGSLSYPYGSTYQQLQTQYQQQQTQFIYAQSINQATVTMSQSQSFSQQMTNYIPIVNADSYQSNNNASSQYSQNVSKEEVENNNQSTISPVTEEYECKEESNDEEVVNYPEVTVPELDSEDLPVPAEQKPIIKNWAGLVGKKPQPVIPNKPAAAKKVEYFQQIVAVGSSIKIERIIKDDLTDLGSRFGFVQKKLDIGYSHGFKRLNFYLITCKVVKLYSDQLKSLQFTQYKAIQANRPRCTEKEDKDFKAEKFQNIHISLIPHVVVIIDKDIKRLICPLKLIVNGNEIDTDLNSFLNVCDIGPSVLNDIDGYIEDKCRNKSNNFFSQIVQGQLDPLVAAKKMNTLFTVHLNKLWNDLGAGRTYNYETYQKIQETYKPSMGKLEDSSTGKLITGMWNATLEFNKIDLNESNSKIYTLVP